MSQQLDSFYRSKNHSVTREGKLHIHDNVVLSDLPSLIYFDEVRSPTNGRWNTLKTEVEIYKVDGDFDCSNCRLIDLQGSPEFVDGDLNCSNNFMSDLTGAPYVTGTLDCSFNRMKNLNGYKNCHKFIGLRNPSLNEVPPLNVIYIDVDFSHNAEKLRPAMLAAWTKELLRDPASAMTCPASILKLLKPKIHQLRDEFGILEHIKLFKNFDI